MNSRPIPVLLMDDEPSSPIIQATLELLRQEGFRVDFVETMSQAIESYYLHIHRVMVLDIDMSHLPDKQQGDGVKILKRFMSLHNNTRVIMFSGAGTVNHWFEAANAHCFAYIDKYEEDAIAVLSEWIRKAAALTTEQPSRPSSSFCRPVCPKRVAVFAHEPVFQTTVMKTLHSVLSADWQIDVTNSLESMKGLLVEKDDFGIFLLFQDVFQMEPAVMTALNDILSVSPRPQVIVGCLGNPGSQPSIQYMANRHPFRMINLSQNDWTVQLAEAVQSAWKWYGAREIFHADAEALKRIHIAIPSDVLQEWEAVDPEDADSFEEDKEDDACAL
jgi:FixJ family two-component response regulator